MTSSKYKQEEVIEYWMNRTSKESLESILENFCILFAYNPSLLENTQIRFNDVRQMF